MLSSCLKRFLLRTILLYRIFAEDFAGKVSLCCSDLLVEEKLQLHHGNLSWDALKILCLI